MLQLPQHGPSFRSTIMISAVLIIILLVIAFVIFQARYLLMGPQIHLAALPTGPHNERVVQLTGTTRNISHIWLNGRPIYTDPNGNFNEALILENGYTVATLRAEDRYGRDTTVVTPLVYVPATFVQ